MNLGDLITDLKSDEGWVPHAYKDSLGYWTIGFGFLIHEGKGELSKEVAEFWLGFEAQNKWESLLKAQPWIESQPEAVQRALANMSYQLGVVGVGKFHRMIAALKAGDRERAADEALDSTWARQTPNRAERVTDMMRG